MSIIGQAVQSFRATAIHGLDKAADGVKRVASAIAGLPRTLGRRDDVRQQPKQLAFSKPKVSFKEPVQEPICYQIVKVRVEIPQTQGARKDTNETHEEAELADIERLVELAERRVARGEQKPTSWEELAEIEQILDKAKSRLQLPSAHNVEHKAPHSPSLRLTLHDEIWRDVEAGIEVKASPMPPNDEERIWAEVAKEIGFPTTQKSTPVVRSIDTCGALDAIEQAAAQLAAETAKMRRINQPVRPPNWQPRGQLPGSTFTPAPRVEPKISDQAADDALKNLTNAMKSLPNMR